MSAAVSTSTIVITRPRVLPPRVCFEIDQAGQVFDYGRFECDSSVEYQSVVAFGDIRVVEDEAVKRRFCDELMAKDRTKSPDAKL